MDYLYSIFIFKKSSAVTIYYFYETTHEHNATKTFTINGSPLTNANILIFNGHTRVLVIKIKLKMSHIMLC